ncbi:MAG: DnaJ domain-containing protein, partial [Pseudomonadota bacterium]|nr:DnaJ domain-containing protein [Pseudomonadota bacterium]
ARLNWRSEEFVHLLRMVSGQAQFGDIQAESKKLDAAYDLLGVQKSVTDQELKKSYRRLMNQHHPDKLVAKGLPEEMIDIATQKTQDIKAAYELIKKHRS